MRIAALVTGAVLALVLGVAVAGGEAAAGREGAPVEELSLQVAGVGRGASLLACSAEGQVYPVQFAGRPGDGIDVRGVLASDGTVLAQEMEVDDVEFQLRFRNGQVRLQGQIVQVRGPVVLVLTAGGAVYQVRFAAGAGDIVELSGYAQGRHIEATEMEIEGHSSAPSCIGPRR